MEAYWFALGVLGVWRVTHLLNAEEGPFGVFARLRRLLRGGPFGELVACFYCLSMWVAAPVALLLGTSWRERLLIWLALSGGGSLLQRGCRPAEPASAVHYFEDEEARDALLRSSGDPDSSRL